MFSLEKHGDYMRIIWGLHGDYMEMDVPNPHDYGFQSFQKW